LITWLLGRNLAAQMEQTIASAATATATAMSSRQPSPSVGLKTAIAPESVPMSSPVSSPVSSPTAPSSAAALSASSQVQSIGVATPGPLAAGFVNAIKEPVLAILGHAQLVRSKIGDAQQVESHAESIEREARRVKKTIDRMMSWTEPSSPLSKIEPLDLKALLATVLAEHEEDFKVMGVFVASELHDVPKVRGTAEDVKVAVANLFANAFEAMRARSKKHLRITLELNSQGVRLAVSDTGVGMTRDVKEHAFEPFFKSFETPGRIGLGLSMVQRAVRSMGGNCEIESTLGEGATFNLNLPVTAEDRQLFHNTPLEAVAPRLSLEPPSISERAKHVLPPLERGLEPPAGAAVVDRDDDAFDDEDEKFTNISLTTKEPLSARSLSKTPTGTETEYENENESRPEEFRVKVRRPRVRS
jgi:two-component sensor histidine kinase